MKKIFAQMIFKTGILRVVQRSHAHYLTVLNYHRIGIPTQTGFDTFKPNISATPDMFAQQMDLVSRWFNVVSLTQLTAWLNGNALLPSHAVLITFDDGYLDNYLQAAPILRQYNFPALIFLTTEYIGQDRPFFWDLIAYCLYHTTRDHISLSGIGDWVWHNVDQLEIAIHSLTEKIKTYPENEKQQILEKLPAQLNVSIPNGTFQKLIMNWDQVRELQSMGVEFGGHTMTHPILTQVNTAQAYNEIEGSKRRVEDETGNPVLGFAYPNGQETDFNTEIIQMVAQIGYQAAFSLIHGKDPYNSVYKTPFQIKRIFIGHNDTLLRFAVQISGAKRFGFG